MKRKYIISLALLAISFLNVQAQEERNKGIVWSSLRGLEYEVKAGFGIGGTAPLPLPQEIRSIDSYSPTMLLSVEGNVTKWLGQTQKWGVSVGIRLETKGMETKASVKNYSMELISDDGKVSGVWTGGVNTKVRNSYLTLPVVATHRLTERWNLSAGLYASYLLDGDFSGHVYDGYLREGDPTGTKVDFTDGKIATYDFSDNLRKFQWGAQVGTEWKAFKHLNVYADLTWGLNDIFEKDFNTITFAMYPIYLNLGFGYSF